MLFGQFYLRKSFHRKIISKLLINVSIKKLKKEVKKVDVLAYLTK